MKLFLSRPFKCDIVKHVWILQPREIRVNRNSLTLTYGKQSSSEHWKEKLKLTQAEEWAEKMQEMSGIWAEYKLQEMSGIWAE